VRESNHVALPDEEFRKSSGFPETDPAYAPAANLRLSAQFAKGRG